MKLKILSCVLVSALLVSCSGPVEGEAGQPNTPPAPDFATSEYLPEYDFPNYAPARSTALFRFAYVDDTVVYNDTRNNLFYYSELGSGESYPLCARPECTHEGRGCDAYGRIANLQYYDGKLYFSDYVLLPGAGEIKREVMACFRMNPDGSGKEMLKIVGEDSFNRQLNAEQGSSSGFSFCHRGYNYSIICVAKVVDAVPSYDLYVLRRPVDWSSDYEVIYSEKLEGAYSTVAEFIRRINGSSLYFTDCQTIRDEETGASRTLRELRRFDLSEGTMTVLGTLPEKFSPVDLWVTEKGEIYISGTSLIDGTGGVYRFNNGLEPLYSEPETSRYYFVNGAIVTADCIYPEFKVAIRDFDGSIIYQGDLPHAFTETMLELNPTREKLDGRSFSFSYCYGGKDELNIVFGVYLNREQMQCAVHYDITPEGLKESLLWHS